MRREECEEVFVTSCQRAESLLKQLEQLSHFVLIKYLYTYIHIY